MRFHDFLTLTKAIPEPHVGQAKQERMSSGAAPPREMPLLEEMPVSMEPRESLANKVRQAVRFNKFQISLAKFENGSSNLFPICFIHLCWTH